MMARTPAARGAAVHGASGLGCADETWDTRLTLHESWTRDEVEVPLDAWESEPWFESGLLAMPGRPELPTGLCTRAAGTISTQASALAPQAGSDLGFLVPGYSLWEWEKFDLPEIISGEFECCLRWHNLNATRKQHNVAAELEMGVNALRERISRQSSGWALYMQSVDGPGAGRGAARRAAGRAAGRGARRESFHPFWRPAPGIAGRGPSVQQR
jgi:hypothetical protein